MPGKRLNSGSELEEPLLANSDLVINELAILFCQVSYASHGNMSLFFLLVELTDVIFVFVTETPSVLHWQANCLQSI